MNEVEAHQIAVTVIGKVEREVLSHLCSVLAERFGSACSIGPALPAPIMAYNPRRDQYSAETILDTLWTGEKGRTLGVVDLDLYVPDLNFVFGLADRVGKRAVVALPRLRQDFYGLPDDQVLFLARAAKEAVHELGHTFGLGHCQDRGCVMAFSNSLADTDTKAQEFCSRCRKKVQW